MELYTPRLQEYSEKIEQELVRAMPPQNGLQKTVACAMAYACEAGGKRLRPVLLLEFTRLCGGQADQALPFACALEMIHSYSLVHDDLPCMDNSLLRRGRPSVFAKYGEDMALLAGDGLLTRAFEWMLKAENCSGIDPKTAMTAAFLIADAAGIGGMVGGQTIDLQSEGKTIDLPTLQALQEGKTAALIMAACEAGAVLGGASAAQREAARRFGYELGLCFQIVDDLLDVTSTQERLGKPVGADENNQKATYVSLLGFEEARALAKRRTEAAKAELELFGEEAQDLRALTEALLSRTV